MWLRESEIVAGHMIGTRAWLSLFSSWQYANMILIAALTATLFFGGWSAPLDFAPFNMIPGIFSG